MKKNQEPNKSKFTITEQRHLLSLLYDLGEEYLSKPDTRHNQAIIDCASFLIDEMEIRYE